MELVRRISIFVCVFCAASTYWFTDITPLYKVKTVDFREEQKNIGSEKRMMKSMSRGIMGVSDDLISQAFKMNDRELYLSQAPLQDFFNEITKGRIIEVEGSDWENFFNDIRKEIQRRLLKERQLTYVNAFLFSVKEFPLNNLNLKLTGDNSQIYFKNEFYFLKLKNSSEETYLKLEYFYYDHKNFYSGKFTPELFYPFSRYYVIFIILGVILYVFLPWPKKEENEVTYKRWKIALNDIAFFTMPIPVMLIPFWINHSTALALLNPGSWFIWFLALLFYPVIRKNAWLSSYKFRMNDDGLEVETYKGIVNYYYSDVVSYQQIISKPPSWLKVVSAAAIVLGGPVSATGQSGEYYGISISFSNNRSLNLWFSKLLNENALKKYESVIEILESRNILLNDHALTIKSISLNFGTYNQEIKEINKSVKKENRKEMAAGMALGLILLLCMSISLFVHISNLLFEKEHTDIYGSKRPNDEKVLKGDSMVIKLTVIDKDVEWVKIFGKHDTIEESKKIIPLTGGGYIVIAESENRNYNIYNKDRNIYIIKLDKNFNTEWEKLNEYPEKSESVYDVKELSDGSFIIAGRQTDKAYLMKIDSHGNKIWDNLLGRYPEIISLKKKSRKIYFSCEARIINPENNGFIISGLSAPVKTDEYSFEGAEKPYNEIMVIRTDMRGDSVSGISFPLYDSATAGKFAKIDFIDKIKDEGYIITGSKSLQSGKFIDLLLIKIDRSGFKVFEKTFGGKGKETGSFAMETNDKGFLFIGAKNEFNEKKEDLYIVKTNSAGELEWEKAYGTGFSEEGVQAGKTRDGGYIVLGNFYTEEERENSGIYLLKIDKNGIREWEKYLTGTTIIKPEYLKHSRQYYSGSCILQAPDGSYIITGEFSYVSDSEGWEDDLFLMKVGNPKK